MSGAQAKSSNQTGPSPLQPVSMPSFDGFNAAALPFFPLKYQTQHLAGTDECFLWTGNVDGKEKDFFFHRYYGPVAPNADTADYFLLLRHLLLTSDDPQVIHPNFHEIETLKPLRKGYKPNQKRKEAIIRHLDALQGLNVHTNAAYNREKKRWDKVRTNVLNYRYEDDTGKVRKRTLTKTLPDGTNITYLNTENIGELADVEFSRWFLEAFLSDQVYVDLAVYFALEDPTPKGMFRFANRTVQTLGAFSCDARHFFWNILGMSSKYVVTPDHPQFRQVISSARKYAQRINETEGSNVRILLEKAKSCPSGYKFIVDKAQQSIQASLFPSLESFTERERKSYALLRTYGIYPNAAVSLVRRYRSRLGREASDYIQYVIRTFRSKYVKTGKLTTPQHKWGGVLFSFFNSDFLFPEYSDWAQARRTKQTKLDHSLYGESIKTLFAGTPAQNTQNLFLAGFSQNHPDLYRRIVADVHLKYDQLAADLPAGVLTPYELKTRKSEAINHYCRLCILHFDKGSHDYYPPILTDASDAEE